MTKRVFWIGVLSSLALSAALPFGAGCGGTKSCADLCAEREACPDVMPSGETCEAQCKAADTFAKAAKCEAEEQAWNECLSPLENICNAQYDCATEALHRDDCYTAYCNKNPSTSGCENYTN